jgi:CheY-like chemotaxis protein
MTETAGLRVLHVDDDPDVVELTARAFSAADGVTVETAVEPEAALDALDGGRFDCLVSDSLLLPDGEPFVEAARGVAPDAAVLVFTGTCRDEVAATARAVDAVAVVRKGAPGSVATLRDHLSSLAGDDDASPPDPAATGDGVDRPRSGSTPALARGRWEHVATHDLSSGTELVVTLAAVLDDLVADDERVEPLYRRVDVESLESFVRASDDDVRVTFAAFGWEFAVAGDGGVAARPRA